MNMKWKESQITYRLYYYIYAMYINFTMNKSKLSSSFINKQYDVISNIKLWFIKLDWSIRNIGFECSYIQSWFVLTATNIQSLGKVIIKEAVIEVDEAKTFIGAFWGEMCMIHSDSCQTSLLYHFTIRYCKYQMTWKSQYI